MYVSLLFSQNRNRCNRFDDKGMRVHTCLVGISLVFLTVLCFPVFSGGRKLRKSLILMKPPKAGQGKPNSKNPFSDIFSTRVWCIPEFGTENKNVLFLTLLLVSAVCRV